MSKLWEKKLKCPTRKGGKKKRQNDNFQLQSQKDKKQKRRYILTVFIIISPIKLLKRVLVVFIIVLKWLSSAFWPPPVWGGTWRPQSHRSLPCICLHCLNCSQRCVSFKVETDKGRWIEHSRLSDDYALQTNIISHRMDNFLLARLVCGKKHKNRMICPFILMLIWKLMFNNIWKVKECSKWNDDISYRQFLDMKITNTTNTNIIRNLNLKSQSATYVKHKGAKFVNFLKD